MYTRTCDCVNLVKEDQHLSAHNYLLETIKHLGCWASVQCIIPLLRQVGLASLVYTENKCPHTSRLPTGLHVVFEEE